MCGIVGHLGPENSVDIVMEGLRRLEYRGYDSAGVSFINEKQELEVFKKSGKIENLKSLIEGKDLIARCCIGHTRWATHGEVNDTNSHPHSGNEISLVHNGIIDNASELKEILVTKGHHFESETDSEVFLKLIIEVMKTESDFKKTLFQAFRQVTGNSAFVILNQSDSKIYAIKKGAPLVCGINRMTSSVMVSSDPYALAGLVNRLYFPDDEVLCELSGANLNLLNFYDSDLNKTKKYQSTNQDFNIQVSEKGKYEHFMLKEIHEQPELIRALSQFYFSGEGVQLLKKVYELKPERVIISACGTAYYAGLLIRYYIESLAKIPCTLELASELRYKVPIFKENDLGVFISQSGETADTLAAQSLLKEHGVSTLSILNVDGSSLYRSCDYNLMIRAGVEIGVASTKAFTNMALTGRLFSMCLSGEIHDDGKRKKVIDKLSLLAERIDYLLAKENEIKDISWKIHDKKGFLFTGRGSYFPIALEGALKLKEIAYVHAEGYAAGELKHGPIALIDDSMVNIALLGPELFDKAYGNLQEVKSRKGIVLGIGQIGEKRISEASNYSIELNFEGLEEFSPVLINVALQLLAYHMARFKGTDIDKPRNLAKSVTVE